MAFWNRRKRHWDEQTDEYYAERTREASGKDRFRWFRHILVMAFVGGIFLAAVRMVGGETMLEKTLTALIQPCGLLWLLLIVMIYFCLLLRQSWPALIGIVCWLLLSVAGNSYVANWLATQREQAYFEINPMKLEPYDTVFVLGGGTLSRFDGESQLSWNGDRIYTAAKLYHAGKIKNFICTGTQTFRTTEKDLHPREEAAIILEDLLVRPEHIGQMEGNNTSEEMGNIKRWMEKNPNPGRVGILTSAWHMQRAMRLAESQGVIADPIPTNFMSMPFAPTPNLLIPSATNMEVTRTMLKEYLAGIVAR